MAEVGLLGSGELVLNTLVEYFHKNQQNHLYLYLDIE